jgi:hypothetical protein
MTMALVAIREQIEEQRAAGTAEAYEAQLDDEHVDAEQPLLQAHELAGCRAHPGVGAPSRRRG